MKPSPWAEMAKSFLDSGYKFLVYLEKPQERIPPGAILFAHDSKVIAAHPQAIRLKYHCEHLEDLAGYVLSEAISRRLIAPGDRIIFCRLNGGEGDGFIEMKAPEWPILINKSPLTEAFLFAERLSRDGVGTAIMVGDAGKVLRNSEFLYPNPLKGHRIKIWERKHWEYFEKLASNFDGAFVVDDRGTVVAHGVLLNPKKRVKIEGHGTKHQAVASMTAQSKSTGIVVSEEDYKIRVFKDGKLLHTVGPFQRH